MTQDTAAPGEPVEQTPTADAAQGYLSRRLVWDQYLTLEHAATMFGVARSTLRTAVRQGRLVAQRVGDGKTQPYLVRPYDVARFIGTLRARPNRSGTRSAPSAPVSG